MLVQEMSQTDGELEAKLRELEPFHHRRKRSTANESSRAINFMCTCKHTRQIVDFSSTISSVRGLRYALLWFPPIKVSSALKQKIN